MHVSMISLHTFYLFLKKISLHSARALPSVRRVAFNCQPFSKSKHLKLRGTAARLL